MIASSDQLRILTALAVLKSKPAEQSIFTHVQQLREIFAPQSQASIGETSWKTYGLRLETECDALKAKLNDLEAQNFLNATSSSSAERTSDTLSQSTTSGQKKKNKKRMDNLSLGQIDINAPNSFASGQMSSILLQALSKFSQLSLLPATSGLSPETFLCMTRKLFLGLNEALDLLSTRTSSKALAKVQDDLYSVLASVFSVSTSWKEERNTCKKIVASLLEQFLEVFFAPLIARFLTISEHLVNKGLGSHSNSSASPQGLDCRPGLLALLQAALTQIQLILSPPTTVAVASTQSNSKETNHRDSFSLLLVSLILETVRQLCGALQMKKPTRVSRQHRIQRLAIKGAMWYICTITHFLLGLQERNYPAYDEAALNTDSSRPAYLDLLKKAMLDDLVNLLQHQDRKRATCFAVRHLGPGVTTKSATQLRTAGSQIPLGATQDSCVDASPPDDYCMLDDVEYRMFLQLVERVGEVL